MNAERWLTPTEDRVWRGYRRMWRQLDARLERDLAGSGLSGADYAVLSNLTESDEGRWRARQLAERLQWSSSRLSHQVTRMARRGLVTRLPHPADGRGAVIALTAKGRRAIEAAAPGHVAAVRRHFIDLLSPTQLQALDGISQTIIDHLDPVDALAPAPPR
ncbi:MAG: MarR family winged helix-turn-helix transcriptional regulator [Actinomycetota bacterium]|nr:MarR family winged helix-turn-helix transcriptional regulator [Actinomycetota bacterium]